MSTFCLTLPHNALKLFLKALILAACVLLSVLAQSLLAQTPENPTGAAGEFWPAMRSGCNIDSYTGIVRRKVTDLVVAGSVGAYPLAFGRTSTSANTSDLLNPIKGNPQGLFGYSGNWVHSYQWSIDDSTSSAYFVNYPNGNRVQFKKITSGPGSEDPYYRATSNQTGLTGVRDRLIPISINNPTYAKLLLPDGGQVHFSWTMVDWDDGSHHYSWKLSKIIDPYGQTTNFTYSTEVINNVTYDVTQVIEAAQRWIKIYARPPGTGEGGYSDKLIDHVTGSDGRTVQYTYANQVMGVTGLTTVTYWDSTLAAHYTYSGPHTPADRPLLDTADDPMYAGPMRRIKYEYAPTSQYNTAGCIQSEKSWDGQAVVTFQGGGTHREIRGDGKSRSFAFGVSGGLLSDWSDFEGHMMSRTYDDHKFVNSVTDARLNTTSWTNDSLSGNTLDVTYPATPGTASGLPQGTIHYKYGWAACPDVNNRDANNPYYLYSTTDEGGHETKFTRDENKRIARVDYPDLGYETFTYNSFGQVLTHRLTTGGTESFTYDGRGLKTEYRDPYHDPIGKTGRPTMSYQYDSLDRLSGQTDSQGTGPTDLPHTTNYTYNARNQLTTTTWPTNPDDGLRHTTINGYNLPDGTRTSVTDERGKVTTFTHDEYKRLRSITTPQREPGDNTPRTARIFYDATGVGDDLTHTDSNATFVKSPSGKTVASTYNGNYWKLSTTLGVASPDVAVTTYNYDEIGNPISVMSPNEQPNGKSVTAGYDERNRPAWKKDALQFPTWFTYDAGGRKATVNRANGQTITYDNYDEMNRVRRQTVKQSPDPDAVTEFTYYKSGLLNTMKDPHLLAIGSSYSYSYSYDQMGRKLSALYPPDSNNAQTFEAWHFDSANRLDTYTNRAGNIQTFTYDNLYRQTAFSWNDNGVTPSVTFGYDTANRVTSISNFNAQIERVYFDDNLLKNETATYEDTVPRTVGYTYDADGNRASIRYPDDLVLPVFSYQYTGRNQLKNIIDNATSNPIASYLYDLDGNPASRTLDNGTSSSFSYDALDRVTNISHALNGTPRTFEYGYDSVSNRKWVRYDGTAGDVYGYDLNSQSIAVLPNVSNPTTGSPGVQKINYDANGNRTTFAAYGLNDSYTTNNLNQYTDRSGTSATYDANGNLITSVDGSTYFYDAQNRLISASKDGVDETFAYDGMNRLVSRLISGNPPTPPDPTPTPTATPVATATPQGSPTPPPTEQCKEVTFSGTSQVTMQTATAGATIFYTKGGSTVPPPTHNGGTPTGTGAATTYIYTGPITVPYGQVKTFKALAYKNGMVDSKVTSYLADNGRELGGFSSQSMIPPSSETFYYVYDGWTLIAEFPNNVFDAPTAYLPGIKNLTTNQYYYRDGLGSVTHLADSTGHLVEWYRYDLQGKPLFYSSTGQPLGASTVGNRLLFTGQQWYSELGLYDLRNRFYSPDMGRFVQADPIGFGGDSTNLYRYVGNNPVNRLDPSGLGPILIFPSYRLPNNGYSFAQGFMNAGGGVVTLAAIAASGPPSGGVGWATGSLFAASASVAIQTGTQQMIASFGSAQQQQIAGSQPTNVSGVIATVTPPAVGQAVQGIEAGITAGVAISGLAGITSMLEAASASTDLASTIQYLDENVVPNLVASNDPFGGVKFGLGSFAPVGSGFVGGLPFSGFGSGYAGLSFNGPPAFGNGSGGTFGSSGWGISFGGGTASPGVATLAPTSYGGGGNTTNGGSNDPPKKKPQ